MFRLTTVALLAVLLGLAAADGVWCVEECDRASEASGGRTGAPEALAGTCLYCPPGVALARVALDGASAPLEPLEIAGPPGTSPGIIQPIEHPPRIR